MATNEVMFEVIEKVGVVETYATGWCKELNVISWNGGVPKMDIRDWSPDHEHLSRGITLHREEAHKLMVLLYKYFEEAENEG